MGADRDVRILVVDDQESNIRLLERVLAAAGWKNYRSTTDPEQVEQIFEQWSPDIVLLDLLMPIVDGFEVMRRLKTLVPQNTYFPILAITADVNPFTRQRALSAGAKDFITKPFDNVEVTQRIRNLLETRFVYQQLESQNRTLDEQVRARTREVVEQASIIDVARDAISVRDLNQRLLAWNQGASRLYGWSREEAVGRNATDLLFQRIPPELAEALSSILDVGEWVGEMRQITKDGKEVVVDSSWTLMRDEEGRPRAILAIDSDITAKKKIEAQFLRAQRMESIGTLAGGIAHDLNNLLSPILLGVQLLRSKLADPSDLSILETMRTSAERGADLVRQILSFARNAEGRRTLLQLKHLILELQKMIKHTFPKTIRVRTSISADAWMVQADPTQVHQVLMNLCVNARDAMPTGGELAITAENRLLDENYAGMHPHAKPGPYVQVVVSDTGTGIAPEHLERIYDPFFTTKEVGKGTGLGLSTTLAIVQNHGGFIETTSAVGKGTRFDVYLPAVRTMEGKPADLPPVEPPPGNGEWILVVDDEAPIRQIVSATLESYNYRVCAAGDGVEAIMHVVQNPQDIRLVLLDMMMPLMDGPSTIRAIRKLHRTLPIIVASGQKDSKTSAVDALGVAFLQKPYTAEELLLAIHHELCQAADPAPTTSPASAPSTTSASD